MSGWLTATAGGDLFTRVFFLTEFAGLVEGCICDVYLDPEKPTTYRENVLTDAYARLVRVPPSARKVRVFRVVPIEEGDFTVGEEPDTDVRIGVVHDAGLAAEYHEVAEDLPSDVEAKAVLE